MKRTLNVIIIAVAQIFVMLNIAAALAIAAIAVDAKIPFIEMRVCIPILVAVIQGVCLMKVSYMAKKMEFYKEFYEEEQQKDEETSQELMRTIIEVLRQKL